MLKYFIPLSSKKFKKIKFARLKSLKKLDHSWNEAHISFQVRRGSFMYSEVDLVKRTIL